MKTINKQSYLDVYTFLCANDFEIAEKFTKEFSYRKEFDIDQVIQEAASFMGCTVDEMKSRVQKIEFAIARGIVFIILLEKTKLSTASIAEIFNREHCSVLHYKKKYLLKSDNYFCRKVEEFKERYVY